MSSISLTAKETAEALVKAAQNKVAMTVQKRLLMSIMAGMYIALGAQGFIVTFDNIFIRAAVFPVGLMLIVLVGGELFTGNCLMTFALILAVYAGCKQRNFMQYIGIFSSMVFNYIKGYYREDFGMLVSGYALCAVRI